MTVESAADRAALFNANEFGVAATYRAPGGGAAVACSVLFGNADADLASFTGRPVLAGKTIAVSSDVIAPLKGGTFTIGATVYTIAGDPTTADPDRMIWTCPVR